MSFLYIALASSFVISPVNAEVLKINRNSGIRVGYGIDPFTEQVFQGCIDHSGSPESADNFDPASGPTSGVDMPVRIEQITSYSQLDRYSAESFSAGASYGLASGKFNYSGQHGTSLFSDRAVVGIEASTDYGRWFLKDVKLKPEYAALARTNLKKFYEVCGTEYVEGFRMGQGVKVLMTTSTQITSTFEAIQSSVSASVSAGGMSASVGASVMETAKSLLKVGSLQVQVYSYGGGELKDSRVLIRTETDASRFRDQISSYVALLDKSKAVRTHYLTRPYFPGQGYDPMLTEIKRSRIKVLFDDYRFLFDNQERLRKNFQGDRIDQFLREACVLKKKEAECAKYIEGLRNYLKSVNERIDRIRAAAARCAAATSASECETFAEDRWELQSLYNIQWPQTFRFLLLQSSLDQVRER